MTLSQRHLEMVTENPFLLLRYPPYDKMTDEEWMTHRDLVRKQLVAQFSCSPSYRRWAKESGDEERYWSNFSVGGIVHLGPEASTPFTFEQLKGMSCLEVAQQAQAIAAGCSGKVLPAEQKRQEAQSQQESMRLIIAPSVESGRVTDFQGDWD